ncbi:hypothetical protein AB1K39_17110 [Vibrio cholerae]
MTDGFALEEYQNLSASK